MINEVPIKSYSGYKNALNNQTLNNLRCILCKDRISSILKLHAKKGDNYIAHKVLKRRLPPEAKLGKQARRARRVMAGSVSRSTILETLESNCMKNMPFLSNPES